MSSNYDYSQQQLQRKLGSPLKPYPSPLRTPRSERKRLEPRSANCNSDRTERNQEVNVQVLLRCRPLNDDEVRMNVAKVISCDEQRREVTVLKNIANKQVDRTFTFDKVFGSKAQQRTIYDHAISPIVGEVLEGFNCTVFAYGQTGTGKTYTMEGGMRTKGGELPVDAGIIPRVVRQIFDTLEAQNADYSVKVTFLELYNEEITDLLAHDDYIRSCEDKLRKPISLVEDGKGGVIVRGLEEEVVYSASDIYNLLERGSAKRRTADTLLNRRSSRSHSIFSISIHIKEASIGDEELIKCGKLNLVDLAGSENISRSAVRESRAREAGEINKSLLTLGRVVTALVEHSGHTPYRDSKLTRLLRDSLGGKTKTCIIATVSPSVHCLEETLSTLDYAYRAKNIKNKPEANQKMLKAALLKDLYLEIERMRQDVRAAREKNGVYIPHERFLQDEAERKAMAEKIDHLEFDLDLKQKQVDEFQALYSTEQEKNQNLESELKEFRINLEKSHRTLHELQENYRIAKWTLKEKEFIISNFLHSENSLVERATELRANLETASEDITALFTKIDHKNKLETENRNMVLAFGSHLDQSIENLHNTVIGSVSQQQQQLSLMRKHFCSFILSKCKATELLESRIKKIKAVYASGVKSMLELAHALEEKNSSNLEHLKSTVSDQTMAVKAFLSTAVSETEQVLHDIQSSLVEQENMLALSAQQQEEGLQRSMDLAHIISKTTIDFFENVHNHASKLVKTVEENQTAQCRKFADFEKAFQENSVEEEKQVLEKIAEILAASTARKTNIVSEAMRNMEYMSIGEKKNLQKEMSDLQQLSTNAGKEWDLYTEKIKRQFLEYTLSAADIRSKMEHTLQECSDKVSLSRKQWEHNHLSICHLYESNTTEIESMTSKNISENQTMLEEFASVSCSTDAKFDAGACDLKSAVNDSLSLDHEANKEMESLSTLCSEQLKILQSSNFERISDIRNRADRCLKREYQVDQPTCTTPKRRSIMVPSLASIEKLRTPSFDDLVGKMKSVNTSKPGSIEAMSSCVLLDSPRSPLTAINRSS